MAFLLKVFSGSERLKEKQKSADTVNETFQAELNNVQSKLEGENYELQMLVEMIYDSSYPESQRFLKQPTKDRLYAHKETISSLLFGLAAQGVSVAPLILTHFQKYGCDDIADTLISLLELVRPLLASKDMPEFTSDDILDAIDLQWHSSVRSSPGFSSLRGSTAVSPLQSPRVSTSYLSPRQSISSPRSPSSMERMLGSSPGQMPPYGWISPRKTQSFGFSPPSSLPDTGPEGARAAPPRRSLSSHYPASDAGLSQSYGERLQPLVENDEETNTGLGKFRKHDDRNAEPPAKDEADLSKVSSPGADGNDPATEENFRDFSTAGHNTLAPVLPYNLSSNVNTGEHSKALSINIPRSSIAFAAMELNGGQSTGRTQVANDSGRRNDDAGVRKGAGTIVGFSPLGRVRSLSSSFDKSRLDFSHEQFDGSVRDVIAEVPSEGSSTRISGNKDTARNILESDVPFRDSFSSTNHERHIPEKDITASSSCLPIKGNHVEDSEHSLVYEMNGEELNSTDDSLTLEEGAEEERVDVVKMVDVPTSQVSIKTQLQSDECEEVQEAKDSLSHDSGFYDTSMPTLDHDNVAVTSTNGPHAKEGEDESLDVPEPSSLVESGEHDVQKEITLARDSDNDCEIVVPSSSSLLQGDAKGLEDNIQNDKDKAEGDVGKFLQGSSNEGRDEAVDGVEGDGVVEGVEGDGDKDRNSSMPILASLEVDNSSVSALVKDKEEGEVEVQEQELPHPSSIVDIGTDVLSQSSFSDAYDDGDGVESSSSSDDESSSSTSSSSEKPRSSSSSDDEIGDEISLPSARTKGTEETAPSTSVPIIDEDWDPSPVENGEHHSDRNSSDIEGDDNKAHKAEGTGLIEHVSNPELDLEQGAELHTPSYNSVTFDWVTGKEPVSPSNSTISPSTVATGASLLLLSPQYEDRLAAASTSEVVLSSKIEGELKNPSHSDSDLQASGVEGETAPLLRNELEADRHMKDCEPQSPQQLPIHGSNQQEVNDPSMSLSSDVVTHAFLRGDHVEDGLPSRDLIQNESVIPSHLRVEEANEAEPFVGESGSDQRKESLLVGAADLRVTHNDREAFFFSETPSNDFSDSSAMEHRFKVSEDNESEDHVRHAEAEKHEVPTLSSLEAKASADAGGEMHNLEQCETNGSTHQSIEKGSDATTRSVIHSVEDLGGFGVSPDTDEEAASPSELDNNKEGVDVSDQYGLSSVDSKANGNETGATEQPSNQLISAISGDELARSHEDVLKEHAFPGTSSLTLSSSVDEEDATSLTDQVDEAHDSEKPSDICDGNMISHVEHGHGEGKPDKEDLVVHVDEVILPSQAEEVDGQDFKQLSDASDERKMNNKNEVQQVEKGFDTYLNTEEPAMQGMREPILHSLERGTELDEKDNHVEFATGATTYGVFLHNTKFLDSEGDFVRALTAPVTMAKATEVLQPEPERHSIRDSIVCTPASSDRSSRTHKNIRQKRYNFLLTLCCSCYSKPSAL